MANDIVYMTVRARFDEAFQRMELTVHFHPGGAVAGLDVTVPLRLQPQAEHKDGVKYAARDGALSFASEDDDFEDDDVLFEWADLRAEFNK